MTGMELKGPNMISMFGLSEDRVPPKQLMMLMTGWWARATPLKNMSSSIGMIILNIWENKKCSKPPTSN